jgi:hypothetical protein
VDLTDTLRARSLNTLSQAELETVFHRGLDAGLRLNKQTFRSTIAAYIALVNVASLAALGVGQFLSWDLIRAAGVFTPAALLGVAGGVGVDPGHVRSTRRRNRRYSVIGPPHR